MSKQVEKDIEDVIIFVKGKDGKYYPVTPFQDTKYQREIRKATLKVLLDAGGHGILNNPIEKV